MLAQHHTKKVLHWNRCKGMRTSTDSEHAHVANTYGTLMI